MYKRQAIRYLQEKGFDYIQKKELELTQRAMEGLGALPYVHILGSKDPANHTGIVSFTIDGVHPHDVSEIPVSYTHLNLLTNQALSIGQTAEICGFSNLSHFSRYFKRHCGCSPREWQQQGGKSIKYKVKLQEDEKCYSFSQ